MDKLFHARTRRKKHYFYTILLSTAVLYLCERDVIAQMLSTNDHSKRITITFTKTGKTCSAKLDDSPEARQVMEFLPLELTLADFNKTEKIAGLPKKLVIDKQPEGFAPKRGDITYYIPWGNLAIFYKDFRYSQYLVHLGRLGDCVDNFAQKDDITFLIDKN